jgi:hypothetical protein
MPGSRRRSAGGSGARRGSAARKRARHGEGRDGGAARAAAVSGRQGGRGGGRVAGAQPRSGGSATCTTRTSRTDPCNRCTSGPAPCIRCTQRPTRPGVLPTTCSGMHRIDGITGQCALGRRRCAWSCTGAAVHGWGRLGGGPCVHRMHTGPPVTAPRMRSARPSGGRRRRRWRRPAAVARSADGHVSSLRESFPGAAGRRQSSSTMWTSSGSSASSSGMGSVTGTNPRLV